MVTLAELSTVVWSCIALVGVIFAFLLLDEIRWIRRDNEYRRFPLRKWIWTQMKRALDLLSSS